MTLEDITSICDEEWIVEGNPRDSPFKQAEDFAVALNYKFEKDRTLRDLVKKGQYTPVYAVAFPFISKIDFIHKFPNVVTDQIVIWADEDISHLVRPLSSPLSENEWNHILSITQGISPLTNGSGVIPKETPTLGEAIRYLDRYIALLDKQQEKAALQIAPGPQRIRGLAGTGKTVILAMKAAFIHHRYPDKKILFTFNTQSLYNQIHKLITLFYKANSESDPDWNFLHVRHAWGGQNKAGVYFDTCSQLGIEPFRLPTAKFLNKNDPFRACCQHVLNANLTNPILPQYDYILMDEAQDFPAEFYRVLYLLSEEPHQIYWAYDDLQSLFAVEVPTPEELFGKDELGKPLVTLDGEPYGGSIEKDIILYRSYRCPHEVLMLAHALGLGLYADRCVQMLTNKGSWEALGYIVEEGELEKGNKIVIRRPEEYSPNPITSLYKGKQDVIQVEIFDDHESELNWIAESIYFDINTENVLPEHIIVICLDAVKMRRYLLPLQKKLMDFEILSSIPGVTDSSSAFGEPGRVTLSTVFRAKGNESYVVYIFSFEMVYDYVEALQNRNRAFTAISRSKAWVRISGVGPGMKKAKEEIEKIRYDKPRFKFIFPDPETIRNLSAETDVRRREYKKVRDSFKKIFESVKNVEIIDALRDKDPELIKQMERLISEANKREVK